MLNLFVDNKIKDGIQKFISNPSQVALMYDEEKKDVKPVILTSDNIETLDDMNKKIIFKKKNGGKLVIITDYAVQKFPLSILYIYVNCYCDHLEATESSEFEFSVSDEITSIILYKDRDVWKIIDLSEYGIDKRMEYGIEDMKKRILKMNPEFNTNELPSRYITNGFSS